MIDEIERQGMMTNALSTGALLKAELAGLMDRFPFIGDVRGMGMLLAFEMVADRDSRAPLSPALRVFDRVVEACYRRGLIVYSRRTRGGFAGDHILVAPPMITTPAQVAEIIERLTEALAEVAADTGLEDRGP